MKFVSDSGATARPMVRKRCWGRKEKTKIEVNGKGESL
jgi:hypothetical protein